MSNIDQFFRQIETETEKEFKGAILQATQEIAFEGLNGVVNKNPVDTGFSRANWDVALDGEPVHTEPAEDPIARGLRTIKSARVFQVIHIVNGAIYIRSLEHGHSGQAPGGMVAPTMAELESKYGNIE